MKNKTCSACGVFTPDYLLSCEWKNDLRNLLYKPENAHNIPDTSHMSELELFALFISLINK